jgi:hypothetical protein
VVARIVKLGKTKAIKHSGGLLLTSVPTLTQTCHSGRKEAMILIYGYGSIGFALELFVCVVYVAHVNSKHDNESLFQNLVTNIVEVQTLGGILLLGGDLNVRTATLLNTIDINDLCELLQVHELIEIKQPNVPAKR